MSPIWQSRNVPAARGGDIGATEAGAIVAPGMVRRRLGAGAHFESGFHTFRHHHLRLLCLLMINFIRQRIAFVQNGDLLLGINTNSHAGVTQRIRWTFGLELINDRFKLDGQILGNRRRAIAEETLFSTNRNCTILPVASSMNTSRTHSGARPSNQSCGEPSICTSSPKQARRSRS